MTRPDRRRTGARALVDQLLIHGVERAFCVPGESYLAVLDALHDSREVDLITCRQEGGAAYMADAHGKLTGRPGIAMVTRGPGATKRFGRRPRGAAGFHADDPVRRPARARRRRTRGVPGDRPAGPVRAGRQMGGGDRPCRPGAGDRLTGLPHHHQRPARTGGPRPAGGQCWSSRRRPGTSPPYRAVEPAPGTDDLARLAALLAEAERPGDAGRRRRVERRGRRRRRPLRRDLGPAPWPPASAARTMSTTAARPMSATSASARTRISPRRCARPTSCWCWAPGWGR